MFTEASLNSFQLDLFKFCPHVYAAETQTVVNTLNYETYSIQEHFDVHTTKENWLSPIQYP